MQGISLVGGSCVLVVVIVIVTKLVSDGATRRKPEHHVSVHMHPFVQQENLSIHSYLRYGPKDLYQKQIVPPRASKRNTLKNVSITNKSILHPKYLHCT